MHLVVLAFIRVRSYKHTIYCVTKLVLPYIFSLVFRIAQSELDIVSNRDFLSAVSTAPRFLSCTYFHRDLNNLKHSEATYFVTNVLLLRIKRVQIGVWTKGLYSQIKEAINIQI